MVSYCIIITTTTIYSVFQLCTVKNHFENEGISVVLMHLMHQGPHFDNDSEDNQDSVILKKES